MKTAKASELDKFDADKKAFSNVLGFMKQCGYEKFSARVVMHAFEKPRRSQDLQSAVPRGAPRRPQDLQSEVLRGVPLWGAPLRGALLRGALQKPVKLKKLGRMLSFDVWSVDGEAVRNQLDIDFVAGGNAGRYDFIPDEEIWIESNIEKRGVAPVIVHEIVECIFMQVGGVTYSRAHDMANVIESDMRSLMTRGMLNGGSSVSIALKFLQLLK
jgi:hypothetical protein